MFSARMRLAVIAITLATVLAAPGTTTAQTSELTSADRLALLYTSHLVFDDSGEPIVKVGIADGLDSVRFTPSEPVVVRPTGSGGAELTLPAGQEYTVTISNGEPGQYQYYVVLARFHPDEADALADERERWTAAEVEHQTLELGSLFAISGTMFDNRESLVVTPPFEDRSQAVALARKLEAEHRGHFDLHSELSKHPSGSLTLTGAGDGIELSHRDVLWIDLQQGTAQVADVPTERGNEERSYAQTLVMSPDRDGKLSLVNAVSVETVLRGVVPAEIYSTAPLEALKAQAIAARGTLISQIGVRHMADPYNLCDEQHCQVFAGMGASHERTDEAVAQTSGQILFSGNRIAETYYSSNSGGLSGSPLAVWGLEGRDYLVARYDDEDAKIRRQPPSEDELRSFLESTPDSFSNNPDFSSGRHFRWKKVLTADEVDALVAEKLDVGSVRDIRIVERGTGGRIVRLEVEGTEKTATVERELPVRRLFGGLKSGLFVLDIARDANGNPVQFTFTGGGFGHGVGMDQTGAMGMASKGFDVVAILRHYYHGTEIKDLW